MINLFKDTSFIAGLISKLLYGFKATCFFNCARDIKQGFERIKSATTSYSASPSHDGDVTKDEACFELEKICIENHSRYLSHSTVLSAGGTCSVVELNVLKGIVNKHKYV